MKKNAKMWLVYIGENDEWIKKVASLKVSFPKKEEAEKFAKIFNASSNQTKTAGIMYGAPYIIRAGKSAKKIKII